MSVSCGTEAGLAPEILSVEPTQVTSMAATPATIKGHNFFTEARVRLDSKASPQVERQFRVRIGEAELGTDAVTWVDAETLDIVVPKGLAVGTYDIGVTTPGGKSTTLQNGLTVVAEPVGLALSIEDAARGQGTSLGRTR